MFRTLEKTKNRCIAATFFFLFCAFFIFSLIDLQRRMSEYSYYAEKTNKIITNIFGNEKQYLNFRIKIFIDAVMKDYDFAKLIQDNDKSIIHDVIENIYLEYRSRAIPAISVTVLNSNKDIVYQKIEHGFAAKGTSFVSPTITQALESKTDKYGFDLLSSRLYYSISLPIINIAENKTVGAIEFGLNPEWFSFKLRWFLEDVKTSVYQLFKTSEPGDIYLPIVESSDFAIAYDWQKSDQAFFKEHFSDVDFKDGFQEVNTGVELYGISNSIILRNYDNNELGRLIVAYNMTEYKGRQWGYLKYWLTMFVCTAGLMLLVIFVGFHKYERIITEQEKKLAHRSMQCARGEMLGYIGHQWRQPLHTLSLAIQNIELQNRLGRLDNTLLEKQVGLANKNIDYLTQIIEDWRALLASGTSRQTIDLADSVARAIDIVTPALESSQIRIENRITGPVKTEGFVNDLVQCTVNVLLNAKDALCHGEGERIIILSHREEDGLVTVTYQDSGGGIPERLLEKVFDAYLTTKGDGTGTGLGLYLCRQIAGNLDNGRVWAENAEFVLEGKRYFGACISLQFRKTA